MRILYGPNPFRSAPRYPVVALGAFDGVHLAHQAILKRIVSRAKRKKGTSLLVTFEPHPQQVLRPSEPFSRLTCLAHRLALLSKSGLQICWVIRFTRRFSRLPAETFVKKIFVDRLRAKEIWVGVRLVFGRDRQGDLSLLRRLGRRYGFKVFQVGKVRVGKAAVSSSRIRHLVGRGDLKKVSRFLGRPFSLHGTVVPGSRRGLLLGYPTANLRLCGQMLPPLGVYAVWVRRRGRGFYGLLNLGMRPTFSPTRKRPLAEVHLLGFKGRLYGESLEVFFLRKIREEKSFPGKEALRRQITRDEKRLRRWIANRRVSPPL